MPFVGVGTDENRAAGCSALTVEWSVGGVIACPPLPLTLATMLL